MKRILILIIVLSLLLPSLAQAASYQGCTNVEEGSCEGDPVDVTYQGLVPCGKPLDTSIGKVEVPCQFCHVFIMFNRLINFFLLPPDGLVWIISLLMIILAGFLFMIAYVGSGDPKLFSRANKILTTTFTGLIVALGAWLVINSFFLVIGVKDWTGLKPTGQEGWFKLNCPVEVRALNEI